MKEVKYSYCCVHFKGVYCIINAIFRLRMVGWWESYITVRKRSLSCLVCFHFKLIILSHSLCLHYSLIPLSCLIKRAFIFSLISIYLFIYFAFLHETASPCVESEWLISAFHYSNGALPHNAWVGATEESKNWSICSHHAVRWPDIPLQVHSFEPSVRWLMYSVQYKQFIYST